MSTKLDKCLNEGLTGGERHKGIRKITPTKEKIEGHLNKSIHNFKAMLSFKKEGFSDWSASASFYCLYHGLLAIITKYGYESRNQTCTFEIINKLIDEKKISLTKEELKEIFDKDITEDLENSSKILDIRETMQYSIKTRLEEEEFIELKEKTKKLFDNIRKDIER